MPGLNTDLFKKLARKWVGSIGSGGVADASVTTVPLASSTNLPTDTSVVAVIDRVDANGTKTPTIEESVIGVVSGSNLVTCTRGAEGTAQAHSAGAVVEILFTNKGWGDLVDGILAEHSQLGAHTTDTISEKTSAAGVTVDGVLLKDGEVTTDTINEETGAAGVTIDGVLLKDSEVTTDTINEKTGAAGVTIDSLLIKDGNAAKATVLSTTAKCRVSLSTNQENLTDSTATKVLLDTETYDPGGNFADYKFVVPVTGYYSVIGSIQWRGVGMIADKEYRCYIYVNNASVLQASLHSAVAERGLIVNVSDVLYLAADDYVELWGEQISGANTVDVQLGSATFLMVHLLST